MTQLPRATWRLLLTETYDGATNMAIDEAIANAVRAGDAPPTLRFYQWAPASLSLGRMQKIAAVDIAACRANGWEIVRRASGGRAVLHIDELTYSIAADEDEPRMAGGIMPSYRRLSEALLAGMERAGIYADQSDTRVGNSKDKGPICFDLPGAYEITHSGRKLIGSAQKRSRGVVLQHGAIPLSGDIARIVDGLVMSDVERESERVRLRALATTVSAELQSDIDVKSFTRHLVGGFAEALNVKFVAGALSSAELADMATIRAEKYGNIAWTNRL